MSPVHAEKAKDALVPFSINLEPHLTKVDEQRMEIEKLANLKTMERIKGMDSKPRALRSLWTST